MQSSCRVLPLLTFSLLLGACALQPSREPTSVDVADTEQHSSEADTQTFDRQPTRNVSYVGTVSELERSISMEGTHKLTLRDGQFILLTSTDANLNLSTYLGKNVEIRGSVQPTIEGDGAILRAEEITVLEALLQSSSTASSPSSSSSHSESSSQSSVVTSSSPSTSPSRETSSVASSVQTVLSSSSSTSSTSSSVTSLASEPEVLSGQRTVEALIVLMAKQKYETALWTQKYCTTHLSFCIPAHKNWYFKSFGATTNTLWHVEFGISAIDSLYQGPIVLNLVSGYSASMDAKDGQIKVQGSDVVGFKDWKDDTHFELIADARLQAAVSYMLANLSPFSPDSSTAL